MTEPDGMCLPAGMLTEVGEAMETGNWHVLVQASCLSGVREVVSLPWYEELNH